MSHEQELAQRQAAEWAAVVRRVTKLVEEYGAYRAAHEWQIRATEQRDIVGLIRFLIGVAATPMRAPHASRVKRVDDLLGRVWLYFGWRYATRQMTVHEQELWAEAMEVWERRLKKSLPSERSQDGRVSA